jgi:NDP-sugar pyrophosphorylase family protein
VTLSCVVLAGGLGTRMLPITDAMPKALIPVAGRPFVDWQLRLLASEGIRDVVLCVGYRGGMLRDFVADGSRWGVRVRWVDEGNELRGTAGALRLALEQGALANEFLVLYGDSYLPGAVRPVEVAWVTCRAAALMAVMRNDGRWDRSNLVYRAGRVVLYDKRRVSAQGAELRWIDHGISVLRRDLVEERVPPGARADLGDLMHELSREGLLAGVEIHERFYEAGSPAGLGDLEEYLCGRGRSPTPVPTSQGTRASRASETSQNTSTHGGGMGPAGSATVTRP